ncbi:MAG TPA: nickel-responsive transcriptional regulator NikR [Vicinamibacterales bacterium]|nr:nickel-responsive transcriptional regulator NikR [Vicinamibacterales bacterium]HOG27808.1 nickel-responsive transcriptional regulator NikR [Vicinamibacterales bacterium]HOQ60803.1 nickel-responsive transcriptional regulator NikR [Vicinamibacterales bacterium]HPK70592.1 nickel-responsive transcriptional regulator NikR [Vicinamibacterales bacterium]HPW19353.1 nickel-responsive transcriptional regulator NikR [Vicinamibacterales bacterium]
MSTLARIGVAIDGGLLRQFDALAARKKYGSRSEAFRDLIRDALVQEQWAAGAGPVVGTITLVYDHRVRLLGERLTGVQHDAHRDILSTLHVHLDHDHCLEVIVVRGRAARVREVADQLISMKGVKHGRLTIASAGAGRAR